MNNYNNAITRMAVKMLINEVDFIFERNFKMVKTPWYLRWKYGRQMPIRRNPKEYYEIGDVVTISKPKRYAPNKDIE